MLLLQLHELFERPNLSLCARLLHHLAELSGEWLLVLQPARLAASDQPQSATAGTIVIQAAAVFVGSEVAQPPNNRLGLATARPLGRARFLAEQICLEPVAT